MLSITKEKTVNKFMLVFSAPFVCLILLHDLFFLPLELHERITPFAYTYCFDSLAFRLRSEDLKTP